ncbi:hypothetical protein FSP39_023814 [Pinctada imbricata]|uniref:NAD-dependent epimerase/dehydratase domain-containing protein n=1 Tax=Pinctada imbricata TaxID=66713 RepID=A0AA89C9C0_PINIB|nr:hypothetical protein FSP39_023814 [Pinctada imbricata]
MNVLVFGGNGFMGATTVHLLLERGDHVTLINRGNWYWDSGSRIKPSVRHLSCDRMKSLQVCHDVQEFFEANPDVNFDAVVDFSAYHPFAITDGLDALKGRIGRYIYISSDSVYEVCQKNHSAPSREEDSVRPISHEEQDEMNKRDDYGHRKFACEEELIKQRATGGVPFIALRLPDVIGKRDSTMRWWIYQIWLKLHDYLVRSISVPKFLEMKPLSLVYSDDVAEVILTCIDGDDRLYDQAYNLAFMENPTLLELLNKMKTGLGLHSLDVRIDEKDDVVHLYPSVSKGVVDITKAQRDLGWHPTSLDEVVDELMEFYEDAISNTLFLREQKEIIRTMQTHFTNEPWRVIQGLRDVYGMIFSDRKDEL